MVDSGVSPSGVPPDGVPPDGVPPDIAAMNFEDAVAELEQIVRRLEGGQVKLDEAIMSYERGAQLKRHCERKLAEAQQRVDRIVIGPEGAIGAEPTKLD
ncbi:MAG: exodeoxyribonuclease VII small subunit [Stellaceae bacterium]